MNESAQPVTVTEIAPDTARCRSCGAVGGEVVLDLGDQPASDNFPLATEPGADPLHPLQMWLCSSCGLAQLLFDPTIPEEPLAAEPAALVEQATAAVAKLAAAGWLQPGQRALEHGSPHGGSWLPMLMERGLIAAAKGGQADIVLDCFGLMHDADQNKALNDRTSRVAAGGTLFAQFHSVATIVRLGQWNSLRHGHYAYYSATALVRMLSSVGFQAVSAWVFDLYGGTVLLAAKRMADSATLTVDASVTALLEAEEAMRITTAETFRTLEERVSRDADAVRRWLSEQRAAGKQVVAYGAASRAVALLCKAEVGRDLLPGIGDASVAKQGRRMPGTDIPVISPERLATMKPDVILLLLPDLLDEVRAKLPEIETSGGRWVTVEHVREAGAA